MRTFLIAAEGVSDVKVLATIIEKIASAYNISCICRSIFPEPDATSGSIGKGGWSRLKKWAEKYNSNRHNVFSDKDKEIWARSGMIITPVSTPPITWKSITAPEDSLLVFHLDGDAVMEISATHPNCGSYHNGMSIVEYCRAVLQEWTGLSPDDAIWAIPVQCLESWFLALHSLEVCREAEPIFSDYENLDTKVLYSTLVKLGYEAFSSEQGNQTVDKCDLSENHAEHVACEWDTICSR